MTCHDIADYFIWKAAEKKETLELNRLHGLVYFAQVWFVGFENKFLFEEDFEAWPNGPVIPQLEGRLEEFRDDLSVIGVDLPKLPSEVENHLEGIMDGFWDYSTDEMECMIRKEDPYIDAWAVAEHEGREITIPRSQIQNYYTQIMAHGADDEPRDTINKNILQDILIVAQEALERPGQMKDMALWLIIKKAETALRGEVEEAE
jgi:uncharacterized phage-associated protein